MPISKAPLSEAESSAKTLYTLAEIRQQPDLWPTTCARIAAAIKKSTALRELGDRRVLLTGAGTSAYAASAVAAAWPRATAVPTTDLLLNPERHLPEVEAVISLARSGNSPESAAVVECVRSLRPEIRQVAITCNPESALTAASLDDLIFLDPRSNDRSLVMTSSFSNLVLAGLCLAQPAAAQAAAREGSRRAAELLPAMEALCGEAAARTDDRIVILSSSPLQGWAHEAGLKTLEMTAGRFPVMVETYLGLRHGPMSFVRHNSLVFCLLSSHPLRRLYEIDLIRELREKKLGWLAAIGACAEEGPLFDAVIPAILPEGPDSMRTPFEILAPQLLGYFLSLRIGLNPDNPSPEGVISRVVQGVTIHSPRTQPA